MFPVDRAPRSCARWRDWADAAPDEVSTGCAVVTAPPEEFVPPELRGQPVLGIAALYVGDPEAGADAVQPLRDLGPAVDHIGPMPYTAFQAALDPLAPCGPRRLLARGEYMPELSDAAIEAFLAHAPDLVARSRAVQPDDHLPDRAGRRARCPTRPPRSPTATPSTCSIRSPPGLDPADDEQMIAATRAFAAAMRPFSTGAAYLNFTARGRPRPRRLRRRYIRPPGGAQGHLRPGQPVPAQPEHPAQPARRGARARVSSRAYCGSRTFCHTGKIAEG